MNVLTTIPSLDPKLGGPSHSVSGLTAACAKHGLRVSVWTSEPQQPEWIEPLKNLNVRIFHSDLSFQLKHIIKPELIHDHGVWLPVNHSVAILARRCLIPRIVSPRGMLEPWALNHRKWKKKLAWHLYQRLDLLRAAALHATAPSEAENLIKLGLNRPIFVVPNGVQLPPVGFEDRKSPQDRERVPLLKRAVFLSRIHPKKGLPMLAEAWRRVRPSDWKMIVVGPEENNHRNEMQSLTKRLGIAKDWEFHDEALGDHKWRWLAEAHLMILPTYSENFGNVVPEALMVETPVITTTGAPWKDLETYRCGWWTEPTVDAIEHSLREACSKSTSQLREMGKRGRQWILREFAWPGLAARMAAAYDAVLAKTQTADFVN